MNPESGIPNHVAIIMDGNGRWAKARGLPRKEGHRAGAESVREVVEAAKELGIDYLTLYAFSSENWNRPKSEVSALMGLLERFLKTKAREMMEKNIRLRAIGRLNLLPEKTRRELDLVIEESKDNTGLTLILALSYGSREEMVDAAKSLARKVLRGEISENEITNDSFANELYTNGYPDPDLLVRTSGELRISNFLLWQLSYAEFHISDKNWPDFKKSDLHEAVQIYARRHRRFGRV